VCEVEDACRNVASGGSNVRAHVGKQTVIDEAMLRETGIELPGKGADRLAVT
jgi:hypothetical protein